MYEFINVSSAAVLVSAKLLRDTLNWANLHCSERHVMPAFAYVLILFVGLNVLSQLVSEMPFCFERREDK